jgi:hypothetical protein
MTTGPARNAISTSSSSSSTSGSASTTASAPGVLTGRRAAAGASRADGEVARRSRACCSGSGFGAPR